jgi:hypothetical protein
MTEVRFVSRPQLSDMRRFTFRQAFESLGAQAVHGFGWGVAIFGLLVGVPADIWLPPALLGVVFGSGLFSLVFQWWMYGRNPDRLVETVIADERGLLIEGPDSQVRQAWSIFRDARETDDLFMLSSVRSMSQVLGKRAVGAADLEAFRGLLRGAGLLRDQRSSIRGIVGFLLGAAIAIGMPFVFGMARLG